MTGDNLIPFPSLYTRRPPTLLRPRSTPAMYTLRVDLDGAEPPIWRRLEVSSDLPLNLVHDVVQAAMGWSNSHLHHFTMGPDVNDRRLQPFLTDFDIDEGDEGIPESEVRLDQVLGVGGHRLFYEYDFGDSWEHSISLKSIDPRRDGAPLAQCTAGQRACPPEDVGGIHHYNDVVTALGGGDADDWMQETLDWLPSGFDPAAFDLEDTDSAVQAATLHFPDPGRGGYTHPAFLDLAKMLDPKARRILDQLVQPALAGAHAVSKVDLAAAVRPIEAFLDVVGDDGAELTGAGYLKPAVVERVFHAAGIAEYWIGKGNREELTPPVAQLRSAAQRLGLVRKHRQRLVLTPAGRRLRGDSPGLWTHCAEHLPLGKRREEQHAGVIALLCTAVGDRSRRVFDQYAAGLLGRAGWRVHDQAPSSHLAFELARPTWELMWALRGYRAVKEHDPAYLAALAHAALRPAETDR